MIDIEFETMEEAVQYAKDHMSDAPVDELSEDEMQDELEHLKAACEYEKPNHIDGVSYRMEKLEQAIERDEPFDSYENSRIGSKYLDEYDRLVVIDGDFGSPFVTHYHYALIEDNGSITRGNEASETMPEDDGTWWVSVAEHQSNVESGKLRPARVVEQ